MMEKTSEDIKCHVCGKPAVTTIAGIPVCAVCAQSEELKKDNELIESFEEK